MRMRGWVLAGVLAALSVLVAPSHAATRTVTLTNDGPKPVSLTVTAGDTVVFVNTDSVPHQVTAKAGWTYDSGAIAPGQTSTATPALTAPGSYDYNDNRGIVFLPKDFAGRLVVPAKKPTPGPSATPHVSPSSHPTAAPTTPAPSGQPSASATPSPTVAPSTTVSPTAGPTVTPAPSATPTVVPTIRYADPKALAQPSPHRYGLPALLAGVGIGGVLSLLARYLLSLAPAVPDKD